MKTYNFIFFLILLSCQASAYLPITGLIYTHSIFDINYRHLSILYGALLTESEILLKIYCDNKKNNTTDLTKKLFFLNVNQFNITVAKNNPAAYFDFEDIAHILVWLEKKENSLSSLESLENKLAEKANDLNLGNYNQASFRKHFRKILKLLLLSKAECSTSLYKGFYPQYTTQAILLSYLYIKSSTKKDILIYLIELEKYLPIIKNENNDDYDILKNREALDIWLNSEYDIKDLQRQDILQRLNINSLKTENLLFMQYFVTALIAQKNYLGQFSAQVPQGYFRYKGKLVPDCMETAIREFCNALLYNPDTKKFDLNKFSHLTVSLDLLIFYKGRFSNPIFVKSSKNGFLWLKILADKPGIEYCNDNFEVKPTTKNFINIINYLFGIKAQDLNELCLSLSSQSFKISCKHTINTIKDNKTNLNIEVLEFFCDDYTTGRKFIIEVNLIPFKNVWHGWTIIRPKIILSPFIDQSLKDKIQTHIKHPNKLTELEKQCILELVEN